MPVDPLTDEQREIRDLVRDLARERVAPRAAEIDKSAEFPWDMVELMREHDLLGLPFEERYGGTGTGALMVLVAIEELSKVCATTGLILAVQELGSLGIGRECSPATGAGQRPWAQLDLTVPDGNVFELNAERTASAS